MLNDLLNTHTVKKSFFLKCEYIIFEFCSLELRTTGNKTLSEDSTNQKNKQIIILRNCT